MAISQQDLQKKYQTASVNFNCRQKAANKTLDSDKNFNTNPHLQMFQSSQNSSQCAHFREMMLTNYFSKHLYPAVGVLRSTWFQGKQVNIYQYSTAWLVAPQFLITCQHAIDSQKSDEQVNEILFFPGVDKGKLTTVHSSKSMNFFRAKKIIKFKQTFAFKPTINQLCLIVLKQPVEIPEYIKIFSFELNRFSSIEIIGYPNKKYWRQIDVKLVRVERITSKGCIQTVQNNIINYNNPTEIGMSGGPILTKARNGEVYAIGIHTHLGSIKGINRGLFFTKQVLRYLVSYERQLSLIHSIKCGIVYHNTYGDHSIQGCRLLKGTAKDPNSQIQLDKQSLGYNKSKDDQVSEMQSIQQIQASSKQFLDSQKNIDMNILSSAFYGKEESSRIDNQEQSVDSDQFQKVFNYYLKEYYSDGCIYECINTQ